MIKFDLPAIINFILEKNRTKADLLTGHSQGTLIGMQKKDNAEVLSMRAQVCCPPVMSEELEIRMDELIFPSRMFSECICCNSSST